VDLNQNLSGALEIQLPCHCHIVYNSELLHPNEPCSHAFNKPPEIRQILPPQFLTQEFLSTPTGNYNNMTNDSFDVQYLQNKDDESKGHKSAQTQDFDSSTTQSSTTINKKQRSGDDDDNDDNNGPHLGLLWTVVIFQLVLIMSIIVLGIYRYAKYKKELSYSKERLVYNIYASPSDSNVHESTSVGGSSSGRTSGAYKLTTTPLPDYMNRI
jgi:hypothetical protein